MTFADPQQWGPARTLHTNNSTPNPLLTDMPRPPLTKEQKVKVRSLFLSGKTAAEIGRILDINHASASRLRPLSCKVKRMKKEDDNLNKIRVFKDSSFL